MGLDSIEFLDDIDASAVAYNTAPWLFLDDEEGWQIVPSGHLFGAEQGVLYAEGDGFLSLLSAPGQRIRFDETAALQIRMRITGGEEAYLILRQGGERLFRSEKELADAIGSRGIRIPLKNSSDFSTYTLDLSQYIEKLGPFDSDVPEDVSEELPEPVLEPSVDDVGDTTEEELSHHDIPKRQAYFTQIGLVFPALKSDSTARRISIDSIEILPESANFAAASSPPSQLAMPSELELSRAINATAQEKRSAYMLPYETLPENDTEEQDTVERILLAEIAPSDPFPAELKDETFELSDSGEFIVENEDGEELVATLEYGNLYSYHIEVIDRKNRASELTEAVSIEFARTPTAPEDIEAEAGDEEITLRWTRPAVTEDGQKLPKLAGYRIFRSNTPGEYPEEEFQQIPASQTQFIDSDVSNRETYYYVVQALVSTLPGAGGSQRSNEVSAMPIDLNAPETPEGLVGVYLNHQVKLHWNQVSTADVAGFNIYRGESLNGEFRQVNAEMLQTSSFSDDSVEAKKRYYYYVTALDDEVPPNESAPSELEPIETYPLD